MSPGPSGRPRWSRAVGRLLAGTSLAGSPVLAVSSVDGDGIEALRAALDGAARSGRTARRGERAGRRSRLAIDRVFAVKGRGVVVTGTLRGGAAGPWRDAPARAGRPVRPRSRDPGPRRDGRGGRTGPDRAQPRRDRGRRPPPRPRPDRRSAVVARATGSSFGSRAPLPDRARARLHLGTAAVDAAVGRSGRDAVDLPDGSARRDPPPRGPDRRRRRRPARPAPNVGGGSDRRGGRHRCRAGARDLAATPDRASASGGWPRRCDAGERGRDRGRAPRPARRPSDRPARCDRCARPGRRRGDLDRRRRCRSIRRRPLTQARAVAARALRRQVTIDRTTAAARPRLLVDRLVARGRSSATAPRFDRPGLEPGATGDRTRRSRPRWIDSSVRSPCRRRRPGRGRPRGRLPARRRPRARARRPDRRPRTRPRLRDVDLPRHRGARPRAGRRARRSPRPRSATRPGRAAST